MGANAKHVHCPLYVTSDEGATPMVDDHTPKHTESIDQPIELVPSSQQTGFSVGDRVRVVERPPYIKTADPMPMLRPPDVVRLNEEGTILERRSGHDWSVRFERGVFLMNEQFLESVGISGPESRGE